MSSDLKQYSVNTFNIKRLYSMKKQNLFIPKVKIENYGEVYFTDNMDKKKILDDLHSKFFKFYLNINYKYNNVDEIPTDMIKEIKRIFSHTDTDEGILKCANSMDQYKPNVAIVTIHLRSEEQQMEHVIDKQIQWHYCIKPEDLFEKMFKYIRNKYSKCISISKNDLIGVADEKLIGEIYLSYEVVHWEEKTILASDYAESDVKF